MYSTLNLSFLNLQHVTYKQLQINIKYTFEFVFLLQVLISKAEKQLFPRCKPLFVIWIQVIVIFNFNYVCSLHTFLCWAGNLTPPPQSSVNNAAIFDVLRERRSAV